MNRTHNSNMTDTKQAYIKEMIMKMGMSLILLCTLKLIVTDWPYVLDITTSLKANRTNIGTDTIILK